MNKFNLTPWRKMKRRRHNIYWLLIFASCLLLSISINCFFYIDQRKKFFNQQKNVRKLYIKQQGFMEIDKQYKNISHNIKQLINNLINLHDLENCNKTTRKLIKKLMVLPIGSIKYLYLQNKQLRIVSNDLEHFNETKKQLLKTPNIEQKPTAATEEKTEIYSMDFNLIC